MCPDRHSRPGNDTKAHSDLRPEDWVGRYLPRALGSYARLARLDRPIGTWLLLLPGWWAIALATPFESAGRETLWLLTLFGLGAVLMRGAGCTYNDIVDRDFDGEVVRTRTRPLPSGQVSVRAAILFLAGLLLAALGILLQLAPLAIALGIGSLVLVFTYPLSKRVTYWPQAVLGLTFNWGALLGYAAVTNALAAEAFLLYAAGFFWTLGYDTIYAHQDKEDDALIGVKSLALKLGDRTRPWLRGFYLATFVLLGLAGWRAGLGIGFYAIWLVAGWHLWRQLRHVDFADGASCLATFRSNRDFGLIVLAAVIAGQATA